MRRLIRPICPYCSYDLTGAMDGRAAGTEYVTCSECGRLVHLQEAMMRGANLRRRLRLPGGIVVLAFMMLAVVVLAMIGRMLAYFSSVM
jgi:DNA-directed RNA polymerase subunit RPC12/RpoP